MIGIIGMELRFSIKEQRIVQHKYSNLTLGFVLPPYSAVGALYYINSWTVAGHVSSTYVERLKGISLVVRSEADGSLLLESKVNLWCKLIQDKPYRTMF